jgi:tryptophanyl-tRNA synthetase
MKKMSKSAGEKHSISVFADEDVVRRKIKSAVTDTGDTEAGKMSEGVENLFLLLRMSGGLDAHNSLMDDFEAGALKYVDLKQATADSLVKMTSEFKDRKNEINKDKRLIKDQIKHSASEIRKVAQQTLAEVKDLTGLLNVKF